MSTGLNEKDKELLITNEPFNYNSLENNYFGGYFGNHTNDYIEVLIMDTSDNILETAIVDKSDYSYSVVNGGMKVKTGTVLRKLGYDRGKFKVKYNFFRKLAGSYETVVTDQAGMIYNDEVTPDDSRLDKELFLKENKYIVHEISDSRKELRLVTQNIRDEQYVRDFYKLAARNRKVTADSSPSSNIEFAGTAEEKGNSTQIRFIPTPGMNESNFEQLMVGGTITIPNFFLVNKIYPPVIPTVMDVGLSETEVIGTDIFQASFFLDEGAGTKELKDNYAGERGDTKFAAAYVRFKDLILGQEQQTFQQWDDGVDFEGSGRTLNDIRNLNDSQFKVVYLKRNNPEPIIDIVSNSFLRADTTTSYVWEVTGFDQDNGSLQGSTYDRIQPRAAGADSGGNFRIVPVTGDVTYAVPDTQSPFRARNEISGETANGTSRNGSRIRIELFGKDLHIGIKLTINDNTANDSSTLHLPAIIETK